MIKKNTIFLICLLLVSLTGTGMASGKTRARINDVYVIHFVIDGTNLKAFNRALDDGKLPTVRKSFVEEGATFSKALSAFPSTSTSVYQAYSTGLWPGHAGIPHLERFDREREKVIGYLSPGGFNMINSDFINLRALTNPDVARLQPPSTIFELLYGWPTAIVYSSFSRGATKRYPKIAPIGALWSTYVTENQERVDVRAMKQVIKLYDRKPDDIPRYTLTGLYSTDIMGHKYGPHSDEVQEILEQFDIFIRDFLKLLEKKGIADKTYIIVTADHGMHETGKLFKLRDALEKRGWLLKSSPPPNKDYRIYSANRGVVSSHAYLRHDDGFKPIENPELPRNIPLESGENADLIEFIQGLPATDLVIVRAGERRARIYNSENEWADIECYTVNLIDHCAYIAGKGDPLAFGPKPKFARLLDGKPHATREWMHATADCKYPDAIVSLSQIFHDGRAGDIFITTGGKYGFRKVKKGNHGGPQYDDMRVPILIRGPTVSKGKYGAVRPMDLYALLLTWYGLDVQNGNHDGADPFERYTGEDRDLALLAALDQSFDDTSSRSSKSRAIAGTRKLRIYELASMESLRRLKLAEKLTTLLADMEREKASGKYDNRYTDDHIAIVKRALAWTSAGHARMVEIRNSLKN